MARPVEEGAKPHFQIFQRVIKVKGLLTNGEGTFNYVSIEQFWVNENIMN